MAPPARLASPPPLRLQPRVRYRVKLPVLSVFHMLIIAVFHAAVKRFPIETNQQKRDNWRMGTRKPGRPTTYDPMFCELILDYFERARTAPARDLAPVDITETGYDVKGKKGSQKHEVRRICAELPTIEGFAVSVGIPSKTIKGWVASGNFPEFADAYARAKDIQYQILIDRGVTRQYDPTAFIFVAKNITEMTDKQVLAGDADNPLTLVVDDVGRRGKDGAD